MSRPAGQGARVHAHTRIRLRARTACAGKTSSRDQIPVKERLRNPRAQAGISRGQRVEVPLAKPPHVATALPAQATRARTRTRGSRESRGKTNNRALMPEPARRPKAEAWSHSCPPNLHALPASAQKHATILAVSFLATAAAGLRLLGCRRSVGALLRGCFSNLFSESLLCLC